MKNRRIILVEILRFIFFMIIQHRAGVYGVSRKDLIFSKITHLYITLKSATPISVKPDFKQISC
jgi:hypothetical protein